MIFMWLHDKNIAIKPNARTNCIEQLHRRVTLHKLRNISEATSLNSRTKNVIRQFVKHMFDHRMPR